MTIRNYTRKKRILSGGSNGTPKIKASQFSIAGNSGSIGKFTKRASARMGMTNAQYKQYSLRKDIQKHSGANWDRLDEYMRTTQKKANAKMLHILKKKQSWTRRAISPQAQEQQLAKAKAIQKHYNTKKLAELERVVYLAERSASKKGIELGERPNIAVDVDIAMRIKAMQNHADNVRRRIASHHLAENTSKLQNVANAKNAFVDAVAVRNNYLQIIQNINQLEKQLKQTTNAQDAMQIKQRLIELDKQKKNLKPQPKALGSGELRQLRDNWQLLEKEYRKGTLSGKLAMLESMEKGLGKPDQSNYEALVSSKGYKAIKRGLKNGITGVSSNIQLRNKQIAELSQPVATQIKPLAGADYAYRPEVLEQMSERVLQEAIEHFELQPNMKALSERLRQEKLRRARVLEQFNKYV